MFVLLEETLPPKEVGAAPKEVGAAPKEVGAAPSWRRDWKCDKRNVNLIETIS